MQSVLIITQLIISITLVIVVLLQPSEEGGALGIGGGGGGGGGFGGLFTPRGAGNALTRFTAVLAALFFLNSMALTIVALHTKPQKSILDSVPAKSVATQPVKKTAPKPAAPQLPAVPTPQH